MAFVPWKPLPSGLDKKTYMEFKDGLNRGSPSFEVKDTQFIDGYGWSTDAYPSLSTVAGRTTYGTSGGAVTRLLAPFGQTHMVRAVGTKLQYNSSGTTWSDITGTFADADWSYANFDVGGPVLLLTNGTDEVKKWNGSAISDLNATDAPQGTLIAADNRRVYIAGIANEGDYIYYCAFQDATDWTGDGSGTVEYFTNLGGPITALYCFQGQIWAFKKNAFALIFHTGDARITHRLVEGSNNIGCVSQKSIVEVGEYLFWLGADDVYMGAAGAASQIGQPIRYYLDNINAAHLTKCSAFTDGHRFYLNLVVGSDTEPNTQLIYDTRYSTWYPGMMSKGYRYGVLFNNIPYASDSTGQTYKINDGTTDAGSAIAYQVVTKDFDEGIPENEKEYWELALQYKAPTGTTLILEASVDQGVTYYQIGDPITTGNIAQMGNEIIPLDTLPLGNWVRFRLTGTGPFTLYRMTRFFRIQPFQY
jgi:hypothetical protein